MPKTQKNYDKISAILNDTDKVIQVLQAAVDAALLEHALLGNPVCEWRDNKVVWVQPEEILEHLRLKKIKNKNKTLE